MVKESLTAALFLYMKGRQVTSPILLVYLDNKKTFGRTSIGIYLLAVGAGGEGRVVNLDSVEYCVFL